MLWDYVYELPNSPMVSPTVLIDAEGNQWTPAQVEVGGALYTAPSV